MDTEDDIDIDGTDNDVFGDAQFGEQDVLVESGVDMDVDGVEHVHQRSDHDRQIQVTSSTDVSSSSRPRGSDEDMVEMAILTARSRGDSLALIVALEAKLDRYGPAPPTCRICLSPYVDPTVSTGCWHTCCATCWLRCLGATKLCPMCQRITGASELRRVYL
ncbi:hypothetical protein EV363DRAFT_1313723 [Boletus edulis]|nr:hypothetical protein EV363DRAFT_1313723 [Boletus edulis]